MNIKIMKRYKLENLSSLLCLKRIIGSEFPLYKFDLYSEWKEVDSVGIPYKELQCLHIGDKLSVGGESMVLSDSNIVEKISQLGDKYFEKILYITVVDDVKNKDKNTVLIHKDDIKYVAELIRIEERRICNDIHMSNFAHETQEAPFNVYKLIVISLSIIGIISLGIRFLFT